MAAYSANDIYFSNEFISRVKYDLEYDDINDLYRFIGKPLDIIEIANSVATDIFFDTSNDNEPIWFNPMNLNYIYGNQIFIDKVVPKNMTILSSAISDACLDKMSDFIDYCKCLSFNINTALGTGGASFTLPLKSTGLYDMIVDWGDNTKSTITIYNQPEISHTYSVDGEYTIKIYGTCSAWYFNNTGDCLKLTGLNMFGTVGLSDIYHGFYGCVNATGSIPTFPSTLTVIKENSFRNTKFTSVDFTGIVQIRGGCFYSCYDTLDIITIPSEMTSVFGTSQFSNSQVKGLIWNSPQTAIPGSFFQGTHVDGDIIINTNITSIESFCFYSSTVTGDVYLPNTPVAPTVGTNGLVMALGGVIHVPVGATGYDIAPWTNYTIVYDL